MQINLTFNSLNELADFCERQVLGLVPREQPESARKAGTVEACAEHEACAECDHLPDEAAPVQTTASEVQAEPTKRKRRTKAEIEAEKAAQLLNHVTSPQGQREFEQGEQASPLDNLKAEPAVASNGDQARHAIAEMAGLYDGADRLAHINEGRDFIAKHGFPTYNETMQLADVPANIAGHTPEQVSRHRAAMAWKAAQLAGG